MKKDHTTFLVSCGTILKTSMGYPPCRLGHAVRKPSRRLGRAKPPRHGSWNWVINASTIQQNEIDFFFCVSCGAILKTSMGCVVARRLPHLAKRNMKADLCPEKRSKNENRFPKFYSGHSKGQYNLIRYDSMMLFTITTWCGICFGEVFAPSVYGSH